MANKKLIEVALPLEAINEGCLQEKNPFLKGHPRSMHLWWARRPLAAARAVIFAQLVDDPSSFPELFPTEKEQDIERKRLFEIIEKIVKWENINNEYVMEEAKEEIRKCWERYSKNSDEKNKLVLSESTKMPEFHDPFAGGGGIPLEAQRLGLVTNATDLNPVAVLMNKAMIELPHRFSGKSPVNPEVKHLIEGEWKGASGLQDDVRYYGEWIRLEAKKRIGKMYPLARDEYGERGIAMFDNVNMTLIKENISFAGNNAVFKGDNTIPELQCKGVTALCKILQGRQYAYLADEVGMGKTYQAIV